MLVEVILLVVLDSNLDLDRADSPSDLEDRRGFAL